MDNNNLQWKILYGDYTTFDSSQGGPEMAPSKNVQAIIIPDNDLGRLIISRWDFYIFKETWYGCDHFGLWDYLSEPGFKVVKFGRTIPNSDYQKILKMATEDSDFQPKSAWLDIEKWSPK